MTLGGCAKTPGNVIGKWTYKSVDLPAGVKDTPQAAMIEAQIAGAGIEFTAPNKFVLTGGGLLEGEWTIDGDAILMHPKKMQGKSLESLGDSAKNLSKDMNARLIDGGKGLTLDSLAGRKVDITFERAGS